MDNYIVRLWVDLKVKANSEQNAKEIARSIPLNIQETDDREVYDIQVEKAYLKERN